MARHNEVDPEAATIGVWARQDFVPYVSREDQRSVLAASPSHGLANIEYDDDDGDEYWDDYAIPKMASDNYEAGGEYSPENVEWPIFPEPGDSDPGAVNRRSSNDTDLKTHGAHQYPKPDPREIIKARLANHRLHLGHKPKEEIKVQREQSDARLDAHNNSPTDIRIDRREVDIDRSGTITKQSSSILSLLEETDANPVKIMLVLDQQWGEDWRSWEPETITRSIKDEGVDEARVNLDKIMAIKVLSNTNEFWTNPRTFEKVCLAFSGRMVDWGVVQQPRVHEIAGCVALVERYIAENEFNDSVAAYVAGAAVRDGYVMLPPVLSFAEFPFYNELATTVGDSVMGVQNVLIEALKDESVELPEDYMVQYMRIMRCQYHVQDVIDGAKS